MSARRWIEFKGGTKITAFTVFAAAALIFCVFLPGEAYTKGGSGGRGGLPPLPLLMLGSWVFGWFVLLFVRVEDTRMIAPFDYLTTYRIGSSFLILSAAVLAALLYFRYFHRA